MSPNEFFASRTARPNNPLRTFGVCRLLAGAIFCATALVYLVDATVTRSVLNPSLLQTVLQSGGLILLTSPAAAFEAVRALVALYVLLLGARMLSSGIGGLTRVVLPARAPRDLDAQELVASLSNRDLAAFALTNQKSDRLLRQWFPHQYPLLTQRSRVLINNALGEVSRVLWLMLLLAAAYAVLRVLPAGFRLQYALYLPGFPLLFVATFLAGAALHIGFALRALPAAAPRADVIEFRAVLRGGDPGHIPHGLLHTLDVIRPDDGTPNRNTQLGFALHGAGVADTGDFEGRLTVENQPAIIEMPAPRHTVGLLLAGSLMQVVALFWLLRIPLLASIPAAGLTLILASWLAQLLGGVLLLRLGTRMIRSAHQMLNTCRYQSLAVLLDVKGNFARSQITVGKALHDSIESENLVVRCHGSVTGYAASLLTESDGLLGQRHIVSTASSSSARELEPLVRHWLRSFENEGATIVGVDLSDNRLADLVRANIGVQAHHTAARVLATDLHSDTRLHGTHNTRERLARGVTAEPLPAATETVLAIPAVPDTIVTAHAAPHLASAMLNTSELPPSTVAQEEVVVVRSADRDAAAHMSASQQAAVDTPASQQAAVDMPASQQAAAHMSASQQATAYTTAPQHAAAHTTAALQAAAHMTAAQQAAAHTTAAQQAVAYPTLLQQAGAHLYKACPDCAEPIRAAAMKCRYCGFRFG